MSNDLSILNSANNSLVKAEVDTQISTAKAYPRDVANSYKEALYLCTADQETAQGCIYSLPVGGNAVKGASIRLAEIAAYAWGNLKMSARVTEISEGHVIITGACWDLQKDNYFEVPVRRTIQKDRKTGKPNEFMTNNAVNAAISIALRNAIFRAIPKTLINRLYEETVKVAIGDIKSIGKTAEAALNWFGKAGIPRARILKYYGLDDVTGITAEHIEELIGAKTALMEKSISIEDLFKTAAEMETPKALEELNNQVYGNSEDVPQ